MFELISSFQGPNGATTLFNPTVIQFGPDGRLYVATQGGVIRIYTVEKQGDGSWLAVDEEILRFPDGNPVIRSIVNHDDNGDINLSVQDRQTTGMLVTGTAENPVIYFASSDPRIAYGPDTGLDTNSGVLTKVSWTGTEWESVDLIRGLPRSEENHSINGMVIDPDTGFMYLTTGGNTNHGAPSGLFGYTAEYALSGAILEIDLPTLEAMPVLSDPNAGRLSNGGLYARNYVYDLPTLDDPNIPNDGTREDAGGMDVAGPWGGNDGLNQAILPADAPIRIYADGFRNIYDLVMTSDGKLYTVDNGGNQGLGGDPIFVDGEPTNLPNDGGNQEPEPLFMVVDGGYYGFPNPTRSNQDQSWTVYNDDGVIDDTVAVNYVDDISALVPDGVAIEDGYLIDPSRFTGDPVRLAQSGVRIPFNDPASPALVTMGSSSNGLIEYTWPGELNGDLLVAQFNGNIGRVTLEDDGSATYSTVEGLSGLSLALDLTMGPDGSIWVAEFGGNLIKVFAPGGTGGPNTDIDGDGLDNAVDPFVRDASNGLDAVLTSGQSLVWDFDPDQDGNLTGPNGYGGGLTGVMIDGTTDFEAFFTSPSTRPFQNVQLDNVKFITAGGGGTTVVEFVSNGEPTAGANNAEFLFHTGMSIGSSVEVFDIDWSMYNPAAEWTAATSQQLGGYIGTGDQDNYLKVVASAANGGSIQVLLEDAGIVLYDMSFDAPGLLTGVDTDEIRVNMHVDLPAQTVTPTVGYDLPGGGAASLTLDPVSITGTAVLDAVLGNAVAGGLQTGLAAGLMSSNLGADPAAAFQAIFDDLTVTDVTPGAAVLRIMPNYTDVQQSNFNPNSFLLSNVGGKDIVSVTIDVSSAIYGDSVFDPEGLAGDTTFKPLTIDTEGGTGVADPASYNPYLGAGGVAGYKGLVLNFDTATNGGFNPGEQLGFSIDMDPNSVAGSGKALLDAGSIPAWDVGGISGAELIGSTFTVDFADGSSATGSLIGTGTQAGSQGLAAEDSPGLAASLTVNGLGVGGAGTYSETPQVLVSGPAGETLRVVLTKGFIQPTENLFYSGTPGQQAYAPQLQAQLDALAASEFPANNAVEFQTVDVVLDGTSQDISGLFNFDDVALYDFPGEDLLPLGFAASIIDPSNGDLPKGPVLAPIHLKPVGTFAEDDTFNVIEDGQNMRIAVLANDTGGADLSIVSVGTAQNGTTALVNGEIVYTPDADYAGPDSFTYTAADATGLQSSATVTLDVARSHEQPQSTIDSRVAPELSPSGTELVISRYVQLPATRVNSFDVLGDRIFVSIEGATTHDGKVFEIVRHPDGSVTSELFFDVGAAFAAAGLEQTVEFPGQGGLRSIAFHPDFETNGKFYVSAVVDRPTDTTGLNYISDFPEVTDTDSLIVEFSTDPGTGLLDPASYREVARIAMPQQANHPVKQIEFNPYAEPGDADFGMLYISVGDGTANGLNVSRPASQNNDALGKMLRIDPLEQGNGDPYGIPSDNPFVGDPTMIDEVYALGLRNEHTFSFYQAPDGKVYLITTGVGFDNIDEVNIIEAGDNLGWGYREGPFVAGGPFGNGSGNSTGLEPLPSDEWQFGYRYPATFVAHDAPIGTRGDVFQALSGGFVVTNGSALDGQFIFGDFARSSRLYHVPIEELLAAKTSLEAGESPDLLSWATPSELTLYENADFDLSTTPEIRASFAEIVGNIRSDLRFGQGPEGQIFLTNKHDGWVYIVENSVSGDYVPPTNLAPMEEPLESLVFNGHAYVLADSGQTWEEANATALALGGTLVTIESAVENAAITAAFVAGNPVWLGLNDVAQENVFLDSAGNPASYFNWLPVEPDNGGGAGEDYAFLASESGEWGDGTNAGGLFFDGTYAGGYTNLTVVEYDFVLRATDDNFAIDVGQTAEAIAFGSALGLLDNDFFFRDEPVIVAANGQALTDMGGAVPEITLAGSNGGTFTITAEGGMLFDGGTDFDFLDEGETAQTSVTYTAEIDSGETSTATINVTVTGIASQEIRFGNSTYLLGTPGQTWTQAQAEAQSLGGILLEIGSAAENQFIMDTFLSGDNPIWLGFNDVADEGTFVGADGLPITYANWLGSEPNNGNGNGDQDYAVMASVGGRWDDGGIGYNFFYNFGNGGWSGGHSTQTVIEFVDSNPSNLTANVDTLVADVGAVGNVNVLTNDIGTGMTVTQVGGATAVNPSGNFWVPGDNGGNFWVSPNGNTFFYQGGAFDGLAPGQTATSSVTYVVTDGDGFIATSTITAEISAPDDMVNDFGAQPDMLNKVRGDPAPMINILANDQEDNLSVTQVGNSTVVNPSGNFWVPGDNGGNFWVSPNGSTYFYEAGAFDGLAPGESASSSISYVATDADDGGTALAIITATVTAPADEFLF